MAKDQILKHRQRGVYAIEFAIVFPIFFLVLYALLTYGLIFAAQQTLNFAAENAARSALQWQPGDAQQTRLHRMMFARDRAAELTTWVDSMAGSGQLQIQVCPRGAESGTAGVGGHDALCAEQGAASSYPSQDTIEIVMRYPYRQSPLVPILGPAAVFGFLVPDVLYGRASVDLSIGLGLV